MLIRLLFLGWLLACSWPANLSAQALYSGFWRLTISRPGGIPVYVLAELKRTNHVWRMTLHNATERITLTDLQWKGDSIQTAFPVFETEIRLKRVQSQLLRGTLVKAGGLAPQVWQVEAIPARYRVPHALIRPQVTLSGRWAIQFQRTDSSWRPALAQFTQVGSRLTGTILTPAGDYRYLEGAVWGNQFYLSAVDGAHIYAFQGKVLHDSLLTEARFFAGQAPGERMEGQKRTNAALPALPPVTELKPNTGPLSFRFPDLDSQLVELTQERFRGKRVIVQLMGSWCPNCLDETEFLSQYYNRPDRPADVEIVALAYELTPNFTRSAASLRKFQQRFQVKYPMLVTGVTVGDAEKAAKTIPALTDIKYFPTTLFLDRTGRIRSIHSGFYGPGAPAEHAAFQQMFYETISRLQEE